MKRPKMSNPNNLSKVNRGRADALIPKPGLCNFKNLCFSCCLLSDSHFVECDFHKRGVKCVFKWVCALKSPKLKASSSWKKGSKRSPGTFSLLWGARWTEGGCQAEFDESFLKSRWGLTSHELLFVCIAAACVGWELLPFRGHCSPCCELLSRQHGRLPAELYGED